MTDVQKAAHEECACSRNRQCAFHRAQTKKLERVAQPLHDKKKVQVGIEDLRAKYGKPESVASLLAPRNGPRTGRNGWKR